MFIWLFLFDIFDEFGREQNLNRFMAIFLILCLSLAYSLCSSFKIDMCIHAINTLYTILHISRLTQLLRRVAKVAPRAPETLLFNTHAAVFFSSFFFVLYLLFFFFGFFLVLFFFFCFSFLFYAAITSADAAHTGTNVNAKNNIKIN